MVGISSSRSDYSLTWGEDLAGRLVCILTYGCTYNEGDSDKLREVLKAHGCQFTDDPEAAEVVIINTCIVIAQTERKMIRLFRKLEDRDLYVTGCLPVARSELICQFPDLKLIHPDDIHAQYREVRTDSPSSIGIVQIATGCVGRCRYCITRNARGYIRSIPESEILDQIIRQVRQGAVEIRLTSQDASAYGLDRGTSGLPSLLHSIGDLQGRFKVRVGMMNPATVLPIISDLADSFLHENIFSFLHLPVQSGSDQVLRRMERGYSIQDYLGIISVFRKKIPDISISTDFIVGFPGESPDDFRKSCELVRIIHPESVNVTRYSYRPGSMISPEEDILDRTKKERSRELIRITHDILQRNKQERIGSVVSVIVTEKLRPGSVTARSGMYHNVVIGKDIEPGSVLKVRITGERTHYLIGEEISA